MQHPLSGRTALVTGASRRKGIGHAVAQQLATLGANVFIHHFQVHDTALPWGDDDLDAVRAGIHSALVPGASFGDGSADLPDPAQIDLLLGAAAELTGSIDILVCNQALSGSDGSIFDLTSDNLDAHWQTNTRASLLMTADFARRMRVVRM